jgi:tRNA dimethylallyltransferase
MTEKFTGIIICGPTASGKTGFAHNLARFYNGEIVNADSMQIYRQIPVITSSPTDSLKKELNYHLYNFQDITCEFSVVKYARLAAEVIRDIAAKGKIPIIVGGTGLYINALLCGYSIVPDIKEEVRTEARLLKDKLGIDRLFEELTKLDPLAKDRLKPQDSQRILRAYEIFKQTGRSIFSYHLEEKNFLLPEFKFRNIFLLPERKFLYELCNNRLIQMFASGAIEEVEQIYKTYGGLDCSSMKALGVSEIIELLKGNINEAKAIELACTKTRQYAKRQITWFKHQLKDKETIEFAGMEEYKKILLNFPM